MKLQPRKEIRVSQKLRNKILLVLDKHSRGGAAHYFEDTDLAERTGADIQEVRRQLDVLESESFVELERAHDGYGARIAPKGMVVAEQLRKPPEEGGRGIGFKRD